MLFKFSSIAALVSAASALTLQTPTNWASGSSVNLTWTPSASDQTFSFELSNPTIFNNALGLANNVDPTLGHITLTLPIVPPGSGYTLQAVNISDINTVYAQTGSFAIANTPSSVASSASSASLTLASSSGSGSVSATSSGASSSASGSSGSGSTPTSSNSAPGASVSTFNGNTGGAAHVDAGAASWAVMVVGAAIGAVVGL